jgi:hypothetical protein
LQTAAESLPSPVCTPACTSKPEIDPDLARILDAWPTLAEPIRRAVLALVESAAR